MSKEQERPIPYFVAMVDEEVEVDSAAFHFLGFNFKI